MLKIDIAVVYADGRTAEAAVGPVTQVAFEREHGLGIGAIATDQKMSYIYWLAWHASRSGIGFDPWLESIESIDFNIGKPDPTQPAPAAG